MGILFCRVLCSMHKTSVIFLLLLVVRWCTAGNSDSAKQSLTGCAKGSSCSLSRRFCFVIKCNFLDSTRPSLPPRAKWILPLWTSTRCPTSPWTWALRPSPPSSPSRMESPLTNSLASLTRTAWDPSLRSCTLNDHLRQTIRYLENIFAAVQ